MNHECIFKIVNSIMSNARQKDVVQKIHQLQNKTNVRNHEIVFEKNRKKNVRDHNKKRMQHRFQKIDRRARENSQNQKNQIRNDEKLRM